MSTKKISKHPVKDSFDDTIEDINHRSGGPMAATVDKVTSYQPIPQGGCCMAAHIAAKAPWTCPCECHNRPMGATVNTFEVGLGIREVSLHRVYVNGVIGLMDKEMIDAAIRRASEKAAGCFDGCWPKGKVMSVLSYATIIESYIRKELGL